MKYADWLDEWLGSYIVLSTKARTRSRYTEIVSRHIKPWLGEYEMQELTPVDIQKFIARLMQSGNLRTGEGLSPNSVNSVIGVIQGSLETAARLGLCPGYAADKIKRPKAREKRVDCFTLSEQRQIELCALQGNARLFGIVLCLYTGIRIGELLALEWADVDLGKSELHINKTCHEGKDENGVFARAVDTPKTSSGVRTIPIPKQMLPLLREAKKKSRSKYVISNGEKPVAIRSYQRSFSAILKKLNITHKGFHSLRHTFATRALECGMDVKTLSEILGHKNPNVTLSRYAHSLPEHKKEMMNRLGRLL